MKDIVGKNLLSYLFLGVINFTKLNYFIFEMLKKQTWANFQRIIDFLPKTLSPSSQKYGFGIRKKPIPDPVVKKAPDPGSATLGIGLSYQPARLWLLGIDSCAP
jgi:hypothetical protein